MHQTYIGLLPGVCVMPGGDSHMKQTGMLVGKLNLTLKGDHLRVAQAFCDP